MAEVGKLTVSNLKRRMKPQRGTTSEEFGCLSLVADKTCVTLFSPLLAVITLLSAFGIHTKENIIGITSRLTLMLHPATGTRDRGNLSAYTKLRGGWKMSFKILSDLWTSHSDNRRMGSYRLVIAFVGHKLYISSRIPTSWVESIQCHKLPSSHYCQTKSPKHHT